MCVHFRKASDGMNQSRPDDDVFRRTAAAVVAGRRMIEKIGGEQSHQ